MTRRFRRLLSRRSVEALCLLTLLFFAASPFAAAQAAKSAASASPAASAAKGAQLIDINTATPAELKTLPGIGDAYAKRIVDGRPYTAKNQLSTKGVLPPATYDKIKDSIVARKAKP